MTHIRRATPADAEIASDIVCRCYEAFQETDGWPVDVVRDLKKRRGSIDCIRTLIEDERMWVAEREGRVLGMVSVKGNEITKLFVDPDHQRQGVGRQLFRRAEHLIRDAGHERVFLGAAVRTPVPFYEKMGMTVKGTRRITFGPCVGMTSTILDKSRTCASTKRTGGRASAALCLTPPKTGPESAV